MTVKEIIERAQNGEVISEKDAQRVLRTLSPKSSDYWEVYYASEDYYHNSTRVMDY